MEVAEVTFVSALCARVPSFCPVAPVDATATFLGAVWDWVCVVVGTSAGAILFDCVFFMFQTRRPVMAAMPRTTKTTRTTMSVVSSSVTVSFEEGAVVVVTVPTLLDTLDTVNTIPDADSDTVPERRLLASAASAA